MPDLDAIVVGAGTAGCVVGRRLADAGLRLVVLEAGPGEPRPGSVTGTDIIAAAEDPAWQWSGVFRQPTAASSEQAAPALYRQGYGIGGGSAINALLLAPGDNSDYDRWAGEFGCEGWSGEEFAPWLINAAADADAMTPPIGPVSQAFGTAAVAAGHPEGGCTLDQDRLGVLNASLSICGADRRSAFDRYLADVVELDSVELRSHTPVHQVTMERDRVTGVLLEDGSAIEAPLVVLCGGAVQTPLLLSRSGLDDRPVGQNLRDHASFAFTVALHDVPDPRSRQVSQVLRWSSLDDTANRIGNRTGNGTGNRTGKGPGNDTVDDTSGDLQAFVIDRVDGGHRTDPPLAVVVVGLMDIASTGFVDLASESNSATDKVMVTTGALTAEQDRRKLRDGVRDVRRLLADPAMAERTAQVYIDDRGTPVEAMDAMTDDQLDEWLIGHPGPYAHPCGTCPMGPSERDDAVVSYVPDEGGQVIGYQGLHIIDASIMPQLVRAGLQLPITAMAERLTAGLLLQ